MKKGLKITLLIFLSAIALNGFSQVKGEIDTRVDNWRYWQEKAEMGIIPWDPIVKPKPAVQKGSLVMPKSGVWFNSPDMVIVPGQGTMTQSENSVFISPLDNQIVLNGNNVSGFNPLGTSALFTFDGGNTWSGNIGGLQSQGNSGDPAAAIDLNGRSYMGHINSGNSGQGVNVSDNNGAFWFGYLIQSTPNLDKNHLWVDNSLSSPYEGNVYSAWTNLSGSGSDYGRIQFTTSTSSGASWTPPVQISDGTNAGSHNMAVNIQTGSNGEIYTVWTIFDSWPSREVALGFSSSTDGGSTFSPGVRIHNNIKGIQWRPFGGWTGNLANPTDKNMRLNSYPSMAVDISGGPNNGTIYVVWANQGVPGINTGTDISIYLMKSTDGGLNWSTPSRVNTDPMGNVQFMPWITCDPVTGDLSVVFYDDRDAGPGEMETWVASSYDAGNTWYDFRVSDVAFTPSPIPNTAPGYMGDYLGIAARDGNVYPVWTDNRTDNALSYTSPFSLGCASSLTITPTVANGNVDHQEAWGDIEALNEVESGGEAVYHAGGEVLLTEGFLAHNGSEARAYIEGCTGDFVKAAKTHQDAPYVKPEKLRMTEHFKEGTHDLQLSIFPNPTSDIFEVTFTNESLVNNFNVKIYSMSKGLMVSREFKDRNTNSFQIDIGDYPSGVYIIRIQDSETNQVYSGRIVKE
ncbi:MAG: T9SS type A sorting domain-containing protein [Crocinitomicaceae bacterium]